VWGLIHKYLQVPNSLIKLDVYYYFICKCDINLLALMPKNKAFSQQKKSFRKTNISKKPTSQLQQNQEILIESQGKLLFN